MSYNSRKGHGYGNSIKRAKHVQAKRSSWAKHIDSKLKAPKAKNAEQWLTAPNRFDLPNVDTNKPQKNRITIVQFKGELIKAIKEHPEWTTDSKEDREKLLELIEQKPAKIKKLRQSYVKSGKTITEWLKTVFE